MARTPDPYLIDKRRLNKIGHPRAVAVEIPKQTQTPLCNSPGACPGRDLYYQAIDG